MFPNVLEDLNIHCTQVAAISRRTIVFMFPSVLKYLKIRFSQVARTKGPFPADSKNRI